jgi:DNA primase
VIPDSFKQDLLNRVDIVDVVGRFVQLKKGGANFMGLCPFHNEKSPSFTVSPAKQFYHCFGCGAHGNAIGFLMEYSGLGYVEAVTDLAENAGMKMPEYEARGSAKALPEGPDLYAIMQQAMQFYRDKLKDSTRAVDYLKGRGLSGKVAAQYGLGYAPDGWQSLQAAFPKYDDKSLKDVGLVIENDEGRRYDRFRDRIMFPIMNQRGVVIGFGGRILDAGEPKYLNSPETPLFEKGRELYGLSQARQGIREAGRAIVVEGYMDVIALAQHEVGYAVATLGTATSAIHIQKLFRQTDEIVFCFDGDNAGRKAAWHALEVSLPCLADHKAVKFLFLPAEDDPDTFVRAHGKDTFEKKLVEARPLSDVLLSELKSRVDMSTLEGRSRILHEAKPLLQKISAPALQLQLVKQLADLCGMTSAEAAGLVEIRGVATESRGARSSGRGAPPRVQRRTTQSLERKFLNFLMVKPDLAGELPLDLFEGGGAETQGLLSMAAYARENAGTNFEARLIDQFRGGEHEALFKQVLSELMDINLTAEQADAEFRDALPRLRRRRVEERHDELLGKAAGAALTQDEKAELNSIIKEIAVLDKASTSAPGQSL